MGLELECLGYCELVTLCQSVFFMHAPDRLGRVCRLDAVDLSLINISYYHGS